jgi:hypothetical protein
MFRNPFRLLTSAATVHRLLRSEEQMVASEAADGMAAMFAIGENGSDGLVSRLARGQ